MKKKKTMNAGKQWLTQRSSGYANQMLTRLTEHNIHREANQGPGGWGLIRKAVEGNKRGEM